jgi:hypothetical protein
MGDGFLALGGSDSTTQRNGYSGEKTRPMQVRRCLDSVFFGEAKQGYAALFAN